MNIIKSLIKGYENNFGSAFISIIFVFAALVPSVILFYFLNSSANVDLTGTGYVVRFGGPAALFAALYWYMLDTHKKVSRVAEELSVRGTVYLDNNPQAGVEVLAEGDDRVVFTSYAGSFRLRLDSSQSSWTIVARYHQEFSVKKLIESNQLAVAHRLELNQTIPLGSGGAETGGQETDEELVPGGEEIGMLPHPEEITIFGSDAQRRPHNLGCNPSQAQHEVRLREGLISWQWNKRFSCWCGWIFQDLGIQIDEDIRANYNLEIMYSGTYSGNPSPQVKFLGSDGNNSQLKDFSAYEQQDTARQKHIVTIPVSEFNLELSTDSTKIEKLQFDTGWDSTSGQITIESVKLIRRD